MTRSDDKLYEIALDMQKQLGLLQVATTEQTLKLNSIDEQTKKTNGRVTKLEAINELAKNTLAVKKGKKIVWAAIGAFGGAILLALFIGFFKNLFGLN